MERLGMDEGKEDTKEESRGLDGFEEEAGGEQRGDEDSRQTVASMNRNECGIKANRKLVMEDVRRPERGKGRQGEANEEKDEEEVKGGNEEEAWEVKRGNEEDEEAKGVGGKKEEERHLSVPSPHPQTRCHYQSASFPPTSIFPIVKKKCFILTQYFFSNLKTDETL